MEMLLYLQMLYAIIPILCTSLIRNFGWKHIYCVTNFTYREETRSKRGSLWTSKNVEMSINTWDHLSPTLEWSQTQLSTLRVSHLHTHTHMERMLAAGVRRWQHAQTLDLLNTQLTKRSEEPLKDMLSRND